MLQVYISRFTYAATKIHPSTSLSLVHTLEYWRESEMSIDIQTWRWWSNGIYYLTISWFHILLLIDFILMILSTVMALWIRDTFLCFIIDNKSQTDCNHLIIRKNSCNHHSDEQLEPFCAQGEGKFGRCY